MLTHSTVGVEKPQNSSFGDTFAEFYRAVKANSPDDDKSPAGKITMRQTFSCPHSVDVSRLLAGAQKVVDFVYLTDKRDRRQRTMPDDVRFAMHNSSIAALLYRYAKKCRERIRPDPAFALIYGKCISFFPDGTMRLDKEGIILPQPPITDDFEVLKVSYCYVYADRVELVCNVAAPPFNINQFPVAEYSDDMPELTDADFPKTAKGRKRKKQECVND